MIKIQQLIENTHACRHTSIHVRSQSWVRTQMPSNNHASLANRSNPIETLLFMTCKKLQIVQLNQKT
jgi:hypothetical protein